MCGRSRRIVITLSTANGSFTARSSTTVLIIRPAAISRPHETASSTTTSAPLNRPIRALVDPRESSLSTAPALTREACSAGSVPAASAAIRIRPPVNSATRASKSNVIQNGTGLMAIASLNQRTPITLRPRPTMPPRSASTSTSVRCCLTICPRPAPIATRMATSRRRSDARAASRFETLTHAMSSTPMAAPSIVYSKPYTSEPRSCSTNGSTSAPTPWFVCGNC